MILNIASIPSPAVPVQCWSVLLWGLSPCGPVLSFRRAKQCELPRVQRTDWIEGFSWSSCPLATIPGRRSCSCSPASVHPPFWGKLPLACACKMGCSAPPCWLATQTECEKPCAAPAAVPRRVCRQGSSGRPPSCPSISKYNCSHFPVIDITKQLRIKLFKLIALLNLKRFSLFGWYHCLD